MSTRAPTDKQVYIATAASEQRDRLLKKIEYISHGKDNVSSLFQGITKFISQDPFQFKTTECIDEEKGIFLTKSYSGIEPFVVSFAFSDSQSKGRWLLRIRVVDTQGNVLIE